jgi:hypothetical protein
MRKAFEQQGRHTVLPIVGGTVAEICIAAHRGPAIIIADAERHESIIELDDRFRIGRGTNMQTVEHDRPDHLPPLLELVGASVTAALASVDGRLELAFSNALKLEIGSTTGHEAWHFQFPRPGRPPGGDVANHISLHGAHGHLI